MKNIYLCLLSFIFLPILCASKTEKSRCLEKEKALTLLETAQDLLSKAEDSFPSCNNDSNSTDPTECRGKKPLAYIQISKKLISDVRDNFPNCIAAKVIVPLVMYKDCAAALASGRNESGVYTIRLSESNSTGKPLQVYCDMKTDRGGWTVIQRRGKFPVQQDFDQDWETYVNGFGNISAEFWLGNENIRVLCHKGCEIRFDLQAYNGTKGYAVYKNFNLTRNNYTIYASHYTGDVGDSLKYHNNWPFSTKDKKNSGSIIYDGGWWFSNNTYVNLNGLYQPGSSGFDLISWYTWPNMKSLASTEIKVRPK